MMTDSNNPGGGGGGGQPAGDSHSIELGFDLQEAVTQRLAQRNKKAVQLSDLMTSTKFTKQEICTMYRGFKQVKLLFYNLCNNDSCVDCDWFKISATFTAVL